MSDPLDEGCTSHAGLVKRPKGMGTNSGNCYCPHWKIRLLVNRLRREIKKLKGDSSDRST